MTERQADGSMLDFALRYHDLGLSLIPLKAGTKNEPAVPWKPYQTRGRQGHGLPMVWRSGPPDRCPDGRRERWTDLAGL